MDSQVFEQLRLIVTERQEEYFRCRRIRRIEKILTWGAILLAIEIVLVTLLKGGAI
jgi:hypothetical protein